MSKDCLFVSTAWKEKTIQYINTKNYILNTSIQFAQVWRNGSWRDCDVSVFDGFQWVHMDNLSNRLFSHLYWNSGRSHEFREHDTNTLIISRNIESPANTQGIEGIRNRLFSNTYVDKASGQVMELNLEGLTILRQASLPGTFAVDIAGTNDRLFYCDRSAGLYELDLNTLLPIKQKDSSQYSGLGATKDSLFATNVYKAIYRIDINTLTNLGGVTHDSIDSNLIGTGGIRDRLFASSSRIENFIYEIDTDTLAIIKTKGSYGAISGIGGTK